MILLSLTDPIPDYESILIILLPFNIAVALIIGVFYFWRRRKTKATITLLWALGFTGVGSGILINYLIRYTFYSYFSTILPATWDYSLFNTIGMMIITFSLALSTFYVKLFKESAEKAGRIILSLISILGLIILVINSFIPFDEYRIGHWITRILAIWVIIFFTYFSINSKNYRILTITIGLILATTSGILMTQFYGTMLGLIGNILQFIFYVFIAYGLFFTRQKAS